MPAKLGLIAGGGTLPRRIVEAARAQGRDIFVVALEGQTAAATLEGDIPHVRVRLGAAGKTVKALRQAGCEEVVLAGPVRRPGLAELRPDLKAARFLGRMGTKAVGDDGLLRAVIGLLEEEGFRVVGVHDILGDILAAAGTAVSAASIAGCLGGSTGASGSTQTGGEPEPDPVAAVRAAFDRLRAARRRQTRTMAAQLGDVAEMMEKAAEMRAAGQERRERWRKFAGQVRADAAELEEL
jgi:hypothetical protein